MKKYTWMLLLAVMLTGCGGKVDSGDIPDPVVEATFPEAEVTEAEPEETEAPTNAPFPEADANAVTFDEIGADIAVIINDDDTAVSGTLSVENVDGNNMLKFTDESTTADNLEDAVQKIRIDISRLLAPEDLEKVYSIEFDVYAQAKAEEFINDDGDPMFVPGWIGGGGGAGIADGDWYGFTDFSASGINEYTMERSDACHVTFKFLLAVSGKKWDASVEEPYMQIMRWGMQNISDMYIDNIAFYDADGAGIPLTISDGEAPDAAEEEPDIVEEE